VRATGQIGPLHVDRSDEAAVVAFAGKPDATGTGSASGGYAPYRALGYDCKGKPFAGALRIVRQLPWCRTVFFLDKPTGKLETFYTGSADYVDGHGLHVGMKQADAERRLHMQLKVGCNAAWHFESPTGSLSIEFGGGTLNGTAVKGAHVDAIVVHGELRDAGVFDCL
jgi:hypothetical protein